MPPLPSLCRPADLQPPLPMQELTQLDSADPQRRQRAQLEIPAAGGGVVVRFGGSRCGGISPTPHPPQLMPWSELRPRGRQGPPTLSSGLDRIPDAGPGQDQAEWTRVLMDVGQPRLPLWSHSLEPPPAPVPNSLWPPTIPQAWARGPQDTPVSCVGGVGGVLQPQNPGFWSCPAVPGHKHE